MTLSKEIVMPEEKVVYVVFYKLHYLDSVWVKIKDAKDRIHVLESVWGKSVPYFEVALLRE